jgi:hypothetical protein
MMDECTTATDLYPLEKGFTFFSNHKMPVLSIFTCRIVPRCFPSSVVFLSGPSSANQLFLSFPTFNGYFELTTAARNLNVIGPQKKKIIIRPRSTLFWQ